MEEGYVKPPPGETPRRCVVVVVGAKPEGTAGSRIQAQVGFSAQKGHNINFRPPFLFSAISHS